VVDGVGVEAADEADVVGDFSRVRQEVAEPLAALAVLGEGEDGGRGGEFGLGCCGKGRKASKAG